jgi:type IV fimbrial biogenesis protein FimT
MTMRPTQKGFSLIELLVTLLIVSILLSIAGPEFSSFISNNRMAASINQASISLHLARTEAIKRNSFVSVCPSADWDAANPTCTPAGSFDDGWIVFVDADGDGIPNLTVDVADTVLQTHQAVNEDVDLKVGDVDALILGDQFIIFAPTGYPMASLGGNAAVFNLQICDERGAEDTGAGISAGRWINISPTGRPQMHRTKDAVESANNPLGGCGYMGGP